MNKIYNLDMRISKTLLVGLAIAVWSYSPISASCKDLSQLYDVPTLKRWQVDIQRYVLDTVNQQIEPELKPRGKAILQDKRFNFPLVSNPFTYYYYAPDKTINVSISSVKFLYDLIFANLWLTANGYDSLTIQLYLNMLKYREASAFINGKFPGPFEALGIPHRRFEEPQSDDSEFMRHFKRIFHGALLFVVAHEVAHAILGHRGGSTVRKEIAADLMAYQILARNQGDPTGVMFLFIYLSHWVPNGGDFPSHEQYETWLRTKATHPLNGYRVRAIGAQLYSQPQEFFPDAASSDPRITMLKTMGLKLFKIGEDMDNLTSRREIRRLGLETTPQDLVPRRIAGETR